MFSRSSSPPPEFWLLVAAAAGGRAGGQGTSSSRGALLRAPSVPEKSYPTSSPLPFEIHFCSMDPDGKLRGKKRMMTLVLSPPFVYVQGVSDQTTGGGGGPNIAVKHAVIEGTNLNKGQDFSFPKKCLRHVGKLVVKFFPDGYPLKVAPIQWVRGARRSSSSARSERTLSKRKKFGRYAGKENA